MVDKVCFLCDAMLSKLARYLRMMGFNTIYSEEEDEEILKKGRSEGCILLTRDKLLCERYGSYCIFLASGRIKDQLLQLALELGLKLSLARPPRRCTLCNAPLRYLGRIGGRELWVCVRCGQHYWYGSHTRRIESFLSSLKSILSVP